VKGRKPIPTALHRLHGNPSRLRLPDKDSEVESSVKVPRPPTWLKGEARREWFVIAPKLHAAGLLTNLDLRALAGYCVNFAQWLEAVGEIQRSGTVILGGKRKDAPVQNPYVRIAREAHQAWSRALIEFGMTPSSRTRVKVVKQETVDPFDEFLKT
jgi:P27 family predicted phage terminase small subunit